MGGGPGGWGICGFCYERNYDLLVTEDFDAEDDTPTDRKMKNPITPTNGLPVLFMSVREYLEKQ